MQVKLTPLRLHLREKEISVPKVRCQRTSHVRCPLRRAYTAKYRKIRSMMKVLSRWYNTTHVLKAFHIIIATIKVQLERSSSIPLAVHAHIDKQI